MNKLVKKGIYASLVALTLIGCGKKKSSGSLTGWNKSDKSKTGFTTGTSKYKGQETPPGMVLVEGGTFTMGKVQDDVLFDWNTTPVKQHVSSYYLDEAEVTNQEYLFYLEWMEKTFPPGEEDYRSIYQSSVPDTLVWRNVLGANEYLTENYLRHPAYSNYPVVGVSWVQANRYCKWRGDRVNEKILMDKGILKNIYDLEDIDAKGANNFNTDLYLTDPRSLFGGDTTIYKKGLPILKKKTGANKGNRVRTSRKAFSGRHAKVSDGILSPKFRLPTEIEWEFAAKAIIEDREYNNIRGRKKYSWKGKYTRNKSRKHKGDQLANFRLGKGDYSGIPGWSNDGADITIDVKSYPPNAYGLYDMSGNVSEWVADVYRPIIDNEANDFNYFRGNIFSKKLIDADGKVVIVVDGSVEYDTLDNGSLVPKSLPGSVEYIPITRRDAYMRNNYDKAYNVDVKDGDLSSSRFYDISDEEIEEAPRMYNSPIKPKAIGESGLIIQQYDMEKRHTLVSDKTRVYKGGSWNDRAYWLDPSQRRFLPEYSTSSYIGFRCASDRLGPMSSDRRKPSLK